jgi:hypothetical protein
MQVLRRVVPRTAKSVSTTSSRMNAEGVCISVTGG